MLPAWQGGLTAWHEVYPAAYRHKAGHFPAVLAAFEEQHSGKSWETPSQTVQAEQGSLRWGWEAASYAGMLVLVMVLAPQAALKHRTTLVPSFS